MEYNIDYYVSELKETLQDYPELNHILLERKNGEEYDINELKRYLKRSLARINIWPPKTIYTFENFPNPEVYWLMIIDGAIIEALKMKGILKVRNEMSYQDQGGTTVRLEGKGERYLQIADNLYRGWRESVINFKETKSINDAWGGVYSEFYKDWW